MSVEDPVVHTRWLPRTIHYDGAQLRGHWIRRETGIVGDAWVAFRGSCRVTPQEMADLEDLLSGPGIAGDDMVHFLGEFFDGGDLRAAMLRQRLFAATALELLRAHAAAAGADVAALRRSGDDLYLGPGKLSISVATCSPVSSLLHFAVNVTTAGTPVATAALVQLGVEPQRYALDLLGTVEREEQSMHRARCQVRPKGSV